MRITRNQLRQLIQEELEILKEGPPRTVGPPAVPDNPAVPDKFSPRDIANAIDNINYIDNELFPDGSIAHDIFEIGLAELANGKWGSDLDNLAGAINKLVAEIPNTVLHWQELHPNERRPVWDFVESLPEYLALSND